MNRKQMLNDLEEYYNGVLPVEAVDSLAQKWFARVQYNCCLEWTGSIYAFLDYAVKMKYEYGQKLLRKDVAKPYGPGNLYFGANTGVAPPADMQWGEPETPAEHWDRCVYEFNRARVKAYRKREGTV